MIHTQTGKSIIFKKYGYKWLLKIFKDGSVKCKTLVKGKPMFGKKKVKYKIKKIDDGNLTAIQELKEFHRNTDGVFRWGRGRI